MNFYYNLKKVFQTKFHRKLFKGKRKLIFPLISKVGRYVREFKVDKSRCSFKQFFWVLRLQYFTPIWPIFQAPLAKGLFERYYAIVAAYTEIEWAEFKSAIRDSYVYQVHYRITITLEMKLVNCKDGTCNEPADLFPESCDFGLFNGII